MKICFLSRKLFILAPVDFIYDSNRLSLLRTYIVDEFWVVQIDKTQTKNIPKTYKKKVKINIILSRYPATFVYIFTEILV